MISTEYHSSPRNNLNMVKKEPNVENDARETYKKTNNKRTFDKTKKNGHELRNTESFRGAHRDLQGFLCTYDAQRRADQHNRTTKKISD